MLDRVRDDRDREQAEQQDPGERPGDRVDADDRAQQEEQDVEAAEVPPQFASLGGRRDGDGADQAGHDTLRDVR
ncbi:MAG TPA: hypothetical protein VGG75_18155 [Trebonia sp.]